LTMGIAAVGTAVLNVVEGAGEHLPAEVRWLEDHQDGAHLAPDKAFEDVFENHKYPSWMIISSRLGRRAGIGRDGDAIGNAAQIGAGYALDIPPDVATVFKGLNILNPAFLTPIEKVNVGTA
jgi:hypothetical protein